RIDLPGPRCPLGRPDPAVREISGGGRKRGGGWAVRGGVSDHTNRKDPVMTATPAPITSDSLSTDAATPRKHRFGRMAARAALVAGGLATGLAGGAAYAATFS